MHAKASLWNLAADQLGIFTTGEAVDAGVTRRVLTYLAAKGEIERLHEGCYGVAAVPRTRNGNALAAVKATGLTAAASHSEAARLLQLRRVPVLILPEITVLGTSRPQLTGVTVHRTATLQPCDLTDVDGVRTTTGARTAIDLCACMDRHDITALVDEIICRRLASRQWMCRRARALANGRCGVRHIVWLTAPGAEGIFWSWLERQMGRVLRLNGLPAPDWNVAVHDRRGRIGIVDGLYGAARVVLDLQGVQFHLLTEERCRDAESINRLQLAGYLVLVFMWEDVVKRPDVVAARVSEALETRGVSVPLRSS